MRDKNFDVDLLKTLNDQPMPETPLTDDEFTRVLDAACGRLPQKKPAGHRRFPWGRVAAAAAADRVCAPESDQYRHVQALSETFGG